ncbi:MAG: chorismate-binding protein [gamma proteobacterium symbiont of Bathyaustriella thionipta]|nr:chorismate-binding protein [gamma proteobacterium symbiont of Bathyaustriella thionipta]MCU7949225.1 chorismate-binding protein [gamma proteobacterium symbiont of Bathyaustriella thionipta]MCU7953686.1 chorismate-binding protein [gamma proteobacterium symbiont of Bathyaustriella thionipta]MCU7955813.1 chorismate-binding protein [gamma proteobacterium symbiont of Bathyaustriella thionipta]MCU7967291.1 chorismate-binding protein [gamma proteobacterium symbiont of Bathyaustriella thionipta]
MIDTLIHSLKNQLSQLLIKIQQDNSHYHYISLQTPLKKTVSLSSAHFCESFFLSQPDSGFTLLGLDSLLTFKAKGKQRFNTIKRAYADTLKQWYQHENNKTPSPIAFLAFAFDEDDPMNKHWQSLHNTLLTIPRVLIKQSNSSQSLIINITLDASDFDANFSKIETLLHQLFNPSPTESEPSQASFVIASLTENNKQTPSAYEDWQSLAQKAINQIQSGQFDKLVTSRQSTVQTSSKTSVSKLIQKLVQYYPCCSILSYHTTDKSIVAASPERLLSLHHPDIQSNAIGGTISRNKPSTGKRSERNNTKNNTAPLSFFIKQSSEQTSDELAENNKLLKEHHFISQNIYQNLDPLCHTLKMPISPFLMKLHNLYHLETPVQGKLMDKYDVFDCVEALHPTPAVAGIPTQQAKQWLIDNENYHRGWYTGGFGWIDANMNGDFSVMLRCALLHKQEHEQQINLFSGAGLVAESDPDAEWYETELKLQTILEML